MRAVKVSKEGEAKQEPILRGLGLVRCRSRSGGREDDAGSHLIEV